MTEQNISDSRIEEIVAKAEEDILKNLRSKDDSLNTKIGRLTRVFKMPLIARLAARLVVRPDVKMRALREQMDAYINNDSGPVAQAISAAGISLPVEFCHAEFLQAMRAAFESDRTRYADALKVMDKRSKAMKERIKKRVRNAEPVQDLTLQDRETSRSEPKTSRVDEPPVRLPPPPLPKQDIYFPPGRVDSAHSPSHLPRRPS